MNFRILCIPATLLTLACSNPFASDWEEVVGQSSPILEILDMDSEASVNADVSIRITTGGSGNCTRLGRTEVQRETGTSLLITPYDESRIGRGVCNMNLAHLRRTVSVRFPTAGIHTVRVRANDPGTRTVSVVATRTILVR